MQPLKDYAARPVQDVLDELNSSEQGLSSEDAAKRLEEQGPNALSAKKEVNVVLDFLSHFFNPLLMILIIAALLSFIMGHQVDALIIGCIVLFGVVLNYVQEYSADKALKKLLDSVKTKVTVIRNGQKQDTSILSLVVGDVVFLSAGDMVPADCMIIKAKDFFVNQASITGESFPSEKSEKGFASGSSLSEMTNVVFRGTSIVSGSATAVVVKTGSHTEFGKIAQKLAQKPVKSDFEKGITNFGVFLMKIILIIVVFIFFINSFLKHDYLQSFMFAIAIAVGVTPELMPMIMSVTMTVGSKRMSKKGVIVKRLSSIPNFGSMNILCTDKTGTLTENRISLVQYSDYKGVKDETVLFLAYLNSFNQTGLKNILDDAIIKYKHIDISAHSKVDEIPYDFFRKRLSIVVSKAKKTTMITKGAPEEILKCCSLIRKSGKIVKLDKKSREMALSTYTSLSDQGYRVLAVATRDVKLKTIYSKHDESDMVLQGFVSFLDPPKKDVKDVIKQLHFYGIETKIITGDNELVTRKICEEVGIKINGILLGSDLAKLSEDALKVRAQTATIFARCSPDEKNRIILALKANGNVVGYMGDGINDASSLKNCDVGISVDSAVDIAKESADIVLMRKSLRILKDGVIEGRKTFANTMKYVMMSLSSNFGNMFSAAGAILFLPFLPMLPIQILLNNLIYDFSQVTIPSDNVDKEWIEKPRRWNLDFVKKFMYVFGPLSSLFDFITFFVLFFYIKASAEVFQTGWFVVSLATQTLVIHVVRTKKTPILQSRASKLLVASSIICIAAGWAIPYTPIGAWFKFVPLPLHVMLILGLIVVCYLVTVEIAKRIFYKRCVF